MQCLVCVEYCRTPASLLIGVTKRDLRKLPMVQLCLVDYGNK